MSDAVIVAIITGVFAVLGQLLISKSSAKDLYTKLDKQSELADQNLKAELKRYQDVTDTKIEELTREVRSHNNFAERIPVMEAEEKRLNERIKALESKTA
jgi:chaperonin cofactor prefoldin